MKNLIFAAIVLSRISSIVFSIKYSIVASKVVRPSTIFQIVASLGPETEACRVMASISRDGVAVTTNEALLGPDQSQGILLKVPPDNSGKTAKYVLRVEGHREKNGGLVFEHQNPLEFLKQFLSITISTSRVIYNAEGTINMRILFLTTSLKPYEGIVDLYILDPDDYIIRKWNSKELNVGVLLESYTLPEYPKIGFWTIRVVAEGQIEELKVKVEKFYLPQAYELVAVMPSFVLDTDEYIEASIEGAFITERIAKGDIHVRWYAKKVDYYTPLYNDSALYREEYSHFSKMANIYFNNLFYKQWKNGNDSDNGFDDPHVTLNPALPQRPIMQKWTYLRSDRYIHRSGFSAEPFVIYLDEIREVLGTVENIQVRVEAQMTEFFYNETQHAFAETRIIKKSLSLRFLGPTPMVFKPGMPFESQVSLMFNDIIPVNQETLQSAKLTLKFENQNGEFSVQKYYPNDDNEIKDDKDDIFAQISHEHYAKDLRTKGMLQFKVTPPVDSKILKITALVETDGEFGQVQSSMVAYKSVSENDHFIHVRSSTKEIAVGRYVVFHVKTNFPFHHFDWMILSKNIIIHSGREFGDNIHPEIKTFSLVTSGDMAPGFHIFVHANIDGKVISDSAYYPVATINSHAVEIKPVQLKNHLMSSVEITCRGDPGSVFLVSSTRHSTYPAQGSNTITKGLLLDNLHNLEVNANNYLHKIASTDIYESEPDDVEYYFAPNHEIDSQSSFQARSLFYFSNYLTLSSSKCSQNGSMTCFNNQDCYSPDQKCNGVYDCPDKSDEKGCLDEAKLQLEQIKHYRLSRQSRFEDFYDVGDGDWAWLDVNIDEDGEQFYELEVPETPDDFWLSVFSMSKENGIGMTKSTYNTIRPIDFYCEAPDHVHRGESVGLRCNVINRSTYEIESVVVLKGSSSYSFIHVEAYGYVTSFAPRLSQGDHHHFIWLRPESETEVYIPIAIHVEQGPVDVTLELSTQILEKTQELTIEILPEGSIVHKHTSVLLDLKNRANVLQFMNVIVDETPVIPYEIYRRFVAGSPNAHVTICGDVIGPIFPEDQPVRLETMFPTGHGRFGKGTEYHLFNLGANTWQLHYLRLTNQLTDKFDLAKEVFKQMNIEHSAVMRRFTSQGGVSNWDKSAPSVWLTAWVIRLFSHVSYQDWEDYLYIDPLIVSSGAVWLLNYQSEDGYFTEADNGTVHHAYHDQNVALTAHVLIGLEEVLQNLQGGHKLFVATAKQRGLTYLEKILPQIQDTYQLCLVTYTLALLKSSQADIAYGRLLADAKDDNGMVYWSPSPIVANRVRYEFNRPYWEAKDYQNNDALAVEATSYALQTLFLMEGGGVTMLQEQIVAWLNTMRLGDGGFISTVDTLVALQALVLYSYNSRIKDITDLSVEVDLPDSNYTETLYFSGQTDIAKPQRIDLENVWGHVNFYARGAGQAVAQLDVNYGVDYEPFKDHPATECFDLKIKENFHGRNKSEITINSCFKWTLTSESPVSGMAMLVIDIPSGYKMEQPTADQIVKSGQVPEMRDADVLKSGKTIWYFDHIPNVTRCFQHTVRRYFPVANLTRTRQAVILEPLRPERFFVRTFNATSLYILSICEVCGSYQCPYCPHYSSSNMGQISSFLFVFITFLHYLT